MKNSSILQQLSTRTTALTVHELARFLNVSEKAIYKEVQRGSIRCIRIGSCIRFRPERTAESLHGASGVRHDSEGGRRDTLFPNGYLFHWVFSGWRSLLSVVSFQNVRNSLIYGQIEADPNVHANLSILV